MKTITVILIFSALSFAQTPRRTQRIGQNVVDLPDLTAAVTQQAAQQATFKLSADLATALEKRRVQILNCTPVGASFQCVPAHASLSELLNVVLQPYFQQALKDFPPESIKAAQDAAKKASDEAQAAAERILKP